MLVQCWATVVDIAGMARHQAICCGLQYKHNDHVRDGWYCCQPLKNNCLSDGDREKQVIRIVPYPQPPWESDMLGRGSTSSISRDNSVSEMQ